MTSSTTPFAPARTRAAAFTLAALVTLGVLAGVGGIADQQVDDVLLAQARSASTQVVVVSGHRLPRG